MPAHRAEDANMPQAPHWRPYASVRVPTGTNPTLQNLVIARRLLEHAFGVQMRWNRRQGWDRWHITYTGPDHLLDDAAALGEQILAYPDDFEDPTGNVPW